MDELKHYAFMWENDGLSDKGKDNYIDLLRNEVESLKEQLSKD